MRSNRAGFRALSVLALALVGVVLVAGISPGASKPLTKQKAKKLFYTKAKADQRFVRRDQPLSRGVARALAPPFMELTGMEQEVLDLHTLHDGGSDERLTIPFAARIMATAAVSFQGQGIAIGDVACQLTLTDTAGTTSIGFVGSRILPEGSGMSVPLTGSVLRPPGQYDVSVVCEEGGGDLSFSSGHLAVWALPA